jgi:hypothetical protein
VRLTLPLKKPEIAAPAMNEMIMNKYTGTSLRRHAGGRQARARVSAW